MAAGVAACALAAPALADGAAQVAAPTCRLTVNAREAGTGRATVVVLETVGANQMHVREERGGKMLMEAFSDGRKRIVTQGMNGSMVEEQGNLVPIVAVLRNPILLRTLAETTRDVKVAGHDVVNGQAATVYTFSADTLGVRADCKLWISDKDTLPLKAEGDAAGGANVGAAGSVRVTGGHFDITFSYDPSITVTLPAAG